MGESRARRKGRSSASGSVEVISEGKELDAEL